jgi:hypothetical protein
LPHWQWNSTNGVQLGRGVGCWITRVSRHMALAELLGSFKVSVITTPRKLAAISKVVFRHCGYG